MISPLEMVYSRISRMTNAYAWFMHISDNERRLPPKIRNGGFGVVGGRVVDYHQFKFDPVGIHHRQRVKTFRERRCAIARTNDRGNEWHRLLSQFRAIVELTAAQTRLRRGWQAFKPTLGFGPRELGPDPDCR